MGIYNDKLSENTRNISNVLARLKEEWWETNRKPELEANITKTLEKEPAVDKEILELMRDMLDLVKPKRSSLTSYYNEEVDDG